MMVSERLLRLRRFDDKQWRICAEWRPWQSSNVGPFQ